MNIRRYVANDMREALTSIRTDLGADAVMLSSRKLPNGVEVIAAIDYDDSLLAEKSRKRGISGKRCIVSPCGASAPSMSFSSPLS